MVRSQGRVEGRAAVVDDHPRPGRCTGFGRADPWYARSTLSARALTVHNRAVVEGRSRRRACCATLCGPTNDKQRRHMTHLIRAAVAATVLACAWTGASAQIVVSANDNKATLDNGANKVVASPPPDTVTIIDLNVKPPKVIGELNVPTS